MSIYKDGKLIAGGRQCMPLLSFMWADHQLNDASWLRADTFSWQSGAVYQAAYQHLVDDLPEASYGIVLQNDGTYYRYADGDVTGDLNPYCWSNGTSVYFTRQETPSVGDYVYQSSYATQTEDTIISVGNVLPTPGTETIAGTTISFYTTADGHKICLADQESNVAAIYAATGVAWYYILDTVNQRFKLPRSKHNKYTSSLSVIGNGYGLSLTNGSVTFGIQNDVDASFGAWGKSSQNVGAAIGSSANRDTGTYSNIFGVSQDPTKSGLTTTSIEQDTDQYKYLYFYVGNFTQTALENTAGLNASLFNNKLDLDLGNATSAAKSTIVGLLLPDYENAVQYINNAPASYTTTEPCWVCCKGAALAYNMTIGNTTIAEFLYSNNYVSSWVFCPAGCALTRIATSQYNNFIVVPLKG